MENFPFKFFLTSKFDEQRIPRTFHDYSTFLIKKIFSAIKISNNQVWIEKQ
jgi:hypothetical protein